MFRVRDFVETEPGLVFAVIANLHPPGCVICHLRFVRTPNGITKVESSQEAKRLLMGLKPEYLRFVEEFDRELTVVPASDIHAHHRPDLRLKSLLEKEEDASIAEVVASVLSRSDLGLDELGITGSHLVGAQRYDSDVDLVVYGLDNYRQVIDAVRACVAEGTFALPRNTDWEAIFRKRSLGNAGYSLSEFIWHESRKFNRIMLGGRRFDLLSARKEGEIEGAFGDTRYIRLGKATTRGKVADCSLGWDYPARYGVTDCRHGRDDIEEVVSFTHTYVDQLREGEWGIFRGIVERVDGDREYHRILVGSSREARGEYIKAIRS